MNVRKKLVIQTRHFARYFTLVFQADTRGATQVLDRGGQEDGRGSCLSQVIDRGAEAVARGVVPCASQVLNRGAPRLVPAAPLLVSRTYLILVPRPVPRPLLAATRRWRSRRKTLSR
jgi:hypothetical protein